MNQKILTYCILATALPPATVIAQGYQPGQTYDATGRTSPQSQATPAPPPAQAMYNMAPGPAGSSSAQPTQSGAPHSARPRPAAIAAKPKHTPETERVHNTEDVPDKKWKSQGVAPGEAAKIAAARTQSVAPASTGPQAITSWPTGKKLVCLTYDDGPDPVTPHLLEYLNENKVPATFYMLGERVKEYPHWVEQVVHSGDEIGNHTYDHKLLTKLGADAIRKELVSTQELLTSASDSAPVPTMRPPYGGNNATVRSICSELGYKVVLWDVDTEDWRGRSTAQMINTILKGTSDGSIILMHDRLQRGQKTLAESTTLATTRAVVPELRSRGFTFVTVSQLLSNPRVSHVGSADRPTSSSASATEAQPAAPPVSQ